MASSLLTSVSLSMRWRFKPGQPLDPLRREFVGYILFKEGQTETESGGFYSINNAMPEEDLKRLEIAPLVQ